MKEHNPLQPVIDRVEELLAMMGLHAECMTVISDDEAQSDLFDRLSKQHDVMRKELEASVSILNVVQQLTTMSN